MRYRAILLTLLVVTSASVVMTGGALAASAEPGNQHDLQSGTFFKPKGTVNDTPNTTYWKGEPSDDYYEYPDDVASLADDFATSNRVGIQALDASGAQSIEMDPSDDAADSKMVGTTKSYYTSGPRGYQFKQFTLVTVGDNVEVWVARNMSWPSADDPREDPVVTEQQAEALAQQFDDNMYPTESETFGKPKRRAGNNSTLEQAGVVPDDYYTAADGQGGNRTILLVDNIRDENYYNSSYPIYTAGYYSSTVQDYSDRNIVNVDSYGWNDVNESNGQVGVEGTLAHEYQHLIHNDLDSDETTWINEGMSDYAMVITGYGLPEGHINAYEELPYNSLTQWEDQGAINVLADYGEAFTFQMYLADEYGQDFISNLAHDEANGIEGVDNTLDEVGARRDFDDLYQDFSTAVVTDDIENPPIDEYHVDGLELHVNTSDSIGTAGAWGTNYEEVDVSDKGPITGVTLSGVNYTKTQWTNATDPVTGEGQVLYSGSGNLLDRRAIVEADLSNTDDPTLEYQTYYDIEENWDYGFVQISTDGGETWQSLETDEMSSEVADGGYPAVKENVPGYTGQSDGWVQQSVDLSDYQGEGDVLIAFRYTTDWASVQPGMYVKNVSVGGEDVATDTTEPYMSLREATGNEVEYQFTFIGIKENGNFAVKQLDTRTFDDSEEQELRRFVRTGNLEKIIVASTWAAEPGESGRVPVDVEFSFAGNRGHGHWGDGDDGHHGHGHRGDHDHGGHDGGHGWHDGDDGHGHRGDHDGGHGHGYDH